MRWDVGRIERSASTKWMAPMSWNTLFTLVQPMLKFTKQPKTPEITLKNMAFSEGNQLFASDSHAFRDKINAGMLQFTMTWNWEWIV